MGTRAAPGNYISIKDPQDHYNIIFFINEEGDTIKFKGFQVFQGRVASSKEFQLIIIIILSAGNLENV